MLIGLISFISAGIGKTTTDLEKSSKTEFVKQDVVLTNVGVVGIVPVTEFRCGSNAYNLPTIAVKKFVKEKTKTLKISKKEVPIQKRE